MEAPNVIRGSRPEQKPVDKETSNFPPWRWSSIGPATIWGAGGGGLGREDMAVAAVAF